MVKPNKEKSYLVLSRAEDQKIFIGDDIEIVVCKITEKNVRIGISAPTNVQIVRDDAKHLTKAKA